MTRNSVFSLARWWSIVRKEFLQLRRDRVTFAMIVGVPIIQMALFGYAINTDPKHLDTAIINADNTDITRSLLWGMKNSELLQVCRRVAQRGRRSRSAQSGQGALRGQHPRRIHPPASAPRAAFPAD